MKTTKLRAAAVLFAAALFLCPRVNAAPDISAQSAILMDAHSGRILYARRADEQSLIASTTKIMTALVVCQSCNVLDRVEIPPEAVGVEGSSMYLRSGEVLSVQELLYGLMLQSGNDAAVALAIYCGGTVDGFSDLMNDEARRLGLSNTHFCNPHGLDAPGHYSTAHDLAVLASHAMNNPIFAQTVGTKSVQIGERQLTNHNKLLWRYPGADGVKTGYTRAAGRILVSSGLKDGRRLVAVTISAPDDWNDHAALLDFGFSHYAMGPILQAGEQAAELPTLSGQRIPILAASDFAYPLAEDESITVRYPGPGFLYATPNPGDGAGELEILLDGRPIARIPAVFGAAF